MYRGVYEVDGDHQWRRKANPTTSTSPRRVGKSPHLSSNLLKLVPGLEPASGGMSAVAIQARSTKIKRWAHGLSEAYERQMMESHDLLSQLGSMSLPSRGSQTTGPRVHPTGSKGLVVSGSREHPFHAMADGDKSAAGDANGAVVVQPIDPSTVAAPDDAFVDRLLEEHPLGRPLSELKVLSMQFAVGFKACADSGTETMRAIATSVAVPAPTHARILAEARLSSGRTRKMVAGFARLLNRCLRLVTALETQKGGKKEAEVQTDDVAVFVKEAVATAAGLAAAKATAGGNADVRGRIEALMLSLHAAEKERDAAITTAHEKGAVLTSALDAALDVHACVYRTLLGFYKHRAAWTPTLRDPVRQYARYLSGDTTGGTANSGGTGGKGGKEGSALSSRAYQKAFAEHHLLVLAADVDALNAFLAYCLDDGVFGRPVKPNAPVIESLFPEKYAAKLGVPLPPPAAASAPAYSQRGASVRSDRSGASTRRPRSGPRKRDSSSVASSEGLVPPPLRSPPTAPSGGGSLPPLTV